MNKSRLNSFWLTLLYTMLIQGKFLKRQALLFKVAPSLRIRIVSICFFLTLFQLVIPYNFILYAILSFYVNNAFFFFFFKFMIWKIM